MKTSRWSRTRYLQHHPYLSVPPPHKVRLSVKTEAPSIDLSMAAGVNGESTKNCRRSVRVRHLWGMTTVEKMMVVKLMQLFLILDWWNLQQKRFLMCLCESFGDLEIMGDLWRLLLVTDWIRPQLPSSRLASECRDGQPQNFSFVGLGEFQKYQI